MAAQVPTSPNKSIRFSPCLPEHLHTGAPALGNQDITWPTDRGERHSPLHSCHRLFVIKTKHVFTIPLCHYKSRRVCMCVSHQLIGQDPSHNAVKTSSVISGYQAPALCPDMQVPCLCDQSLCLIVWYVYGHQNPWIASISSGLDTKYCQTKALCRHLDGGNGA